MNTNTPDNPEDWQWLKSIISKLYVNGSAQSVGTLSDKDGVKIMKQAEAAIQARFTAQLEYTQSKQHQIELLKARIESVNTALNIIGRNERHRVVNVLNEYKGELKAVIAKLEGRAE